MVAVAPPFTLNEAEPVGPSLIGALLGSRLEELPCVVQAVHAGTGNVSCQGTLYVRQAGSRFGRLVARLVGMPGPRGNTCVRLTIERSAVGDGPCVERWRRSFAGESLASIHTSDGVHLLECIGRLQLDFELSVAEDRLVFGHCRSWVHVSSRRLRLPRWLAPRVQASVGATPSGELLDVSVRIAAPLVGALLSYAGALIPKDMP